MSWYEETEDNNLIPVIPEEVRDFILNKLTQKDALAARFVCKGWKEDIDNLYNFSVELDEDSPDSLAHFLKLQIRKLTIKKLVGNRIRLSRDEESDSTGPQLTFKHPNTIRELYILKETKISSNNLMALLQLCQNSLQKLWIYLNRTIYRSMLPFDPIFQFQSLKKLKIEIQSIPKLFVNSNGEIGIPSNSFLFGLSRSGIPRLSSLIVILEHETVHKGFASLVQSIVQLMTKNPKGLQELGVQVNVTCFDSDPSLQIPFPKLSAQDLSALRGVTNLTNLVLAVHKKSTEPWLWLQLILNQGELEILSVTKCFPITVPHFRSIIANNAGQLRAINLSCLDSDEPERPFELSMLGCCGYLESLDLRRYSNPESGMQHWFDGIPDAKQLSELPKSLRFLQLFGFQFLTKDLEEFVDSGVFLNLKRLSLYGTGRRKSVGVNATVFEKILELQNRKPETLIYVREFKLREGSMIEVEKFGQVLERCGHCIGGLDFKHWNQFVDNIERLVNMKLNHKELEEQGLARAGFANKTELSW